MLLLIQHNPTGVLPCIFTADSTKKVQTFWQKIIAPLGLVQIIQPVHNNPPYGHFCLYCTVLYCTVQYVLIIFGSCCRSFWGWWWASSVANCRWVLFSTFSSVQFSWLLLKTGAAIELNVRKIGAAIARGQRDAYGLGPPLCRPTRCCSGIVSPTRG